MHKFILSILVCMLVLFSASCSIYVNKSDTDDTSPELLKGALQINKNLLPLIKQKFAPFYHGVASGDPTDESVIIWTKVTPEVSVKEVEVTWQIANDTLFREIVGSGIVNTMASHDYTLKVDINELQAGKRYFYRFKALGKFSIIGETKTLPRDIKKMHIGFVTCADYRDGYFHVYNMMAQDEDLDLIVHLGDYIYEQGSKGYEYGADKVNRKNVPNREILDLDDYRTRYSLYRLDPDLMLVHQKKPFITIWDDHEFANDAYPGGALNHQDDEGDWNDRKQAAKKAYYEWMPIRNSNPDVLYRSFKVGNLMNLIMIDARMGGRSKPLMRSDPRFGDSDRKFLGDKQFTWLSNELDKPAQWKVIGNQVPFGAPKRSVKGELVYSKKRWSEKWSGYPVARQRVADLFAQQDNLVLVTGDAHTAYALENVNDLADLNSEIVSIEFIVPSVNSTNSGDYDSKEKIDKLKTRYLINNKRLKYINYDHGYLKLIISERKVEAEYNYVEHPLGLVKKHMYSDRFFINAGEKIIHH